MNADSNPVPGTPLRIIAIGAHPDDCEYFSGGTAARWAALGHQVLFVSLTNGELGHWKTVGGPLARRRAEEKRRSGEILGVSTRILDNRDGELQVTLENRKAVIRMIREWRADVVLSHRPGDYHPDHRATALLVQDSAYMVTVPFTCQDTPHLERNPLFLYFEDEFSVPAPFRADIVVSIDGVIGRKLDFIDAHESQFFEGGCEGREGLVPADEAGRTARRLKVREDFTTLFEAPARRRRAGLEKWYGREGAAAVRFAEAFEICEYGRSWAPASAAARDAGDSELRRLIPFLPGAAGLR